MLLVLIKALNTIVWWGIIKINFLEQKKKKNAQELLSSSVTNTFACGAWVAESTHYFGTESTR